MEFGIAFKGDLSMARTIALCRQAEVAGFDYVWFFDSHILWSDPYTRTAVCMDHTERLRFGPLVTNPKVRDWSVSASMWATLLEIGDGRFDLGVGRGDSSMRVMGKKPAKIAETIEYCDAMRELVRGNTVQYAECPEPVYLEWTSGWDLPIWIAAYGPKALRMAGEHGDGLVIQLSDPGLCEWLSGQALSARGESARAADDYRVLSCAPVWLGDKAEGVEQTKWFPALVGNHIADIVEKYGADTDLVPESMTSYVERRRGSGAGGEGYNYRQHGEVESDNTYYITDDITESFCLLGEASDHIERLEKLQAAGVTQFTIYLTGGEEERHVAEYGDHVIPHFRR